MRTTATPVIIMRNSSNPRPTPLHHHHHRRIRQPGWNLRTWPSPLPHHTTSASTPTSSFITARTSATATPSNINTSSNTSSSLGTNSSSSSSSRTSSSSSLSSQFRSVRSQLESSDDEQLRVLMAGYRGANLNESDFASEGVRLALIGGEAAADSEHQLPLSYDPRVIAEYWERRPVTVVARITQLLSISGRFLFGLALDAARGKLRENEVTRAVQLRDILTSLGPAYIKLGQALSIRPDLLSPAAMTELQKLCDKVPSFDNALAMQVIQDELGAPWQQLFAELSPEPIAAASLGQVYKGRLNSGEVVAVKVQRPLVLETVTIDLYVLRRVGLAMRAAFPKQLTTDVVALLDEWAERFFEELDYEHEGRNAERFAEQMRRDLPQVVVPRTYFEYTSRRVLTSEWLEGEKLSQSQADDVGQLVGLGVICYLKQLLETGFFHADPHPGNLIRTPDGRLAILDFGLMTQVGDDIKYGMIEAISHLIHRDYEAIVKDFVTLDFIPEGTDLRPILPVLARVFDQALEGGGAKNINFQELAADLAQITFDYPFRIPPYFALIIRAIGVLEGIALVGNPDFALVDEAYPYIAKRLLTDDSPRLRAALRYMVYGRDGVFDADRLIDLLGALELFVESSHTAMGALRQQQQQQGAAAGSGSWEGTTAAGSSLQRSGSSLSSVSSYEEARAEGLPSSRGGEAAGWPFPVSLLPPFWPLPFPLPLPFPGGGEGLIQQQQTQQAAVGGPAAAMWEQQLRGADAGAAAGAGMAAPTPSASALSVGGLSAMTTGAGQSGPSTTRAALRFMLSPEGALFRDFMLDELVRSIDALGRERAGAVLAALGLQDVSLPLLLPGASRSHLPLAPSLTEEDRRVLANVSKILAFLSSATTTNSGTPAPSAMLATSSSTATSSGAGNLASLEAVRPSSSSPSSFLAGILTAVAGGGTERQRRVVSEGVAVAGELLPVLPEVARELVPELVTRLASRLAARAVREVLV